jgi:hypothetical protein
MVVTDNSGAIAWHSAAVQLEDVAKRLPQWHDSFSITWQFLKYPKSTDAQK